MELLKWAWNALPGINYEENSRKMWEDCPAGGRRSKQCRSKCTYCQEDIGTAREVQRSPRLKLGDPVKCHTCESCSEAGKGEPRWEIIETRQTKNHLWNKETRYVRVERQK